MTRKEDVEKVRQILGDAEMVWKRVESQQRVDEENRKAKELREKNEAEARLRATGIVDFFESLRDQGVVKWDHRPVYETKRKVFGEKLVKIQDYLPACILLEGNTVRIFFDDETGPYNVKSYLEGKRLIVEGREKMTVGKDLNMANAVGKAVLEYRNDYDWRGPYKYPEYNLTSADDAYYGNLDGSPGIDFFLKMKV